MSHAIGSKLRMLFVLAAVALALAAICAGAVAVYSHAPSHPAIAAGVTTTVPGTSDGPPWG